MRISLSGVLAAALLLLANHPGQAQTPPSDLTLRITVVAPAAAAPATLDAPPALAPERTAAAVPEPSTFMLVGLGAALMLCRRRALHRRDIP